MIHVYGFDPGEMTGWCHVSVHDGEVGIFSCGEGDHQQVGNILYDNQALKAAIGKKEIEVVFVVEKFTMNCKISQSPWSLETIGLIRYFANHYQVPLYLQTPSQAKNLIPNSVVKKADMYVPGQSHAMDAVRHALFYLTAKRKLLPQILV